VRAGRQWNDAIALAACNGHEAIVKLLIEKGAEPSVQNSRGMTPLHWAAWNGHEAIAKVLVEKGAELSVQNRDGYTPLLVASNHGQTSIVKLLEQYS
jgi:ankyrin repeat protein